MFKSLYFVCFAILFTTDIVVCKPDYLYKHEANGWLKLHKVPATWQDAFMSCHYEGAVLASPLNQDLATAMQTIILKSEIKGPIYLGANALFSQRDFISIEGVPLDDLSITWGSYGDGTEPKECLTLSPDGKTYMSSCTQWLPYMCYKENNDSVLNACGTFDDHYQLNATTGSCYKLHEECRTWYRAHKICAAEGGHLVILDNKEEADVVTDLLPETNPCVNGTWQPTHIGLRDWNKDIYTWLTIHGEKIENVYNNWAKDQPDNKGVNVCGSILRDGTLDDTWCTYEVMFVCEKDPNTSRFEPVSDIEYGTEKSSKNEQISANLVD